MKIVHIDHVLAQTLSQPSTQAPHRDMVSTARTHRLVFAVVAIAAQVALSVACAFVIAQSGLPYHWDSPPPTLAPR